MSYRDSHATDAGSYNLYYVEGGKGVSSGSLTSGGTATGSIPTNGLISYQFTGTASHGMRITVAPSTVNICIYNPDGSLNSGGCISSSYSITSLPATGTYTVVLYGSLTSSVSYSLYYVQGAGSVSSGSLTSGGTATGTIPVNGLISYQFTGTALHGMRTTVAPSTADICIYNPDGKFQRLMYCQCFFH